jgi:D-3-phosphoglycerate dehydrogenase
VRFVRKDRTLEVSGTVFGQDVLRIVDFFGYQMDFEPTPYVLALQNHDVPGIIGKVGTVLGEKGINIAAMQWSRKMTGDKAVSFISVDSEVDDATLAQIKAINGILKASRLRF